MSKILSAIASVLDKLAEEEESKPDASDEPASKSKDKEEKSNDDADSDDSDDSENADTKKQAARAYQRITGKTANDQTIEKIAGDPDLFEALLTSVESNRTPARLGGPSTKRAQADNVPLTKEQRREQAMAKFGAAILGENES